MEKTKLIEEFSEFLEEREYPSEPLESQVGIKWFMPLSADYERDYALGEMFFTSDVSQEIMEEMDIAQMNIVLKRELDPSMADQLRAYFARVNRLLSGGRFDVQVDGDLFVEYGYDLLLDLDESDVQAARKLAVSLDLAAAYISFVYAAIEKIASGEMTVEQALEYTFNQEMEEG